MTRLSPFGSSFQLRREVDDLFDRFFGFTRPVSVAGQGGPAVDWWPTVESYVHDGSLTIRVALPGVDPADVEVALTDGVLSINGERKAQSDRTEGSAHLRELTYGSFERRLALPEGVDASKVTARYVNRMLEVTMPLAVARRKVEIEIGGAPAADRQAIKAA